MKILICCVLVFALSGCIPIGIQGSTRAIHPSDHAGAPTGSPAGALALY